MMSLAAPDLVAAFRVSRIVDRRLLSPYVPCRWEGGVMHGAPLAGTLVP